MLLNLMISNLLIYIIIAFIIIFNILINYKDKSKPNLKDYLSFIDNIKEYKN